MDPRFLRDVPGFLLCLDRSFDGVLPTLRSPRVNRGTTVVREVVFPVTRVLQDTEPEEDSFSTFSLRVTEFPV